MEYKIMYVMYNINSTNLSTANSNNCKADLTIQCVPKRRVFGSKLSFISHLELKQLIKALH